MFLLWPFGIVLLISAAIFRTASLLLAGAAILGLCWFLWKWSRADDTPEWQFYWSRGDPGRPGYPTAERRIER